MPFARLQELEIYYEWAGRKELPVLIFSNSLGTNLRMWDPQIEAFTKHFRVLRCDTRGFGQSGMTAKAHAMTDLAWDVVHLLDELELRQPVSFCGLSMGGMIGMILGALAPQRFLKLALCNTASKFGTAEMWNARIQAVRSGGMHGVAGAVIERWLTPAYRASHPEQASEVLTMLENADPKGHMANCAAVRDGDTRAILAQIRVPCLVVAGTHDASATPAEGRLLAETIQDAQYTELAAAHLSNLEARDEFNRQVLQFLTS